MIPELKAEIDKAVEHAEKHFADKGLGGIDCWVLLPVKDDKIAAEPLAIFNSKARLYEKFEDFAKTVDKDINIVIASWKFD